MSDANRQPQGDVLAVSGLNIWFETVTGRVQAVNDLSFHVRAGETVGLVGESGSGKSVTALAIMGLLPKQSSVVTGEARLHDRDLMRLSPGELARARGKDISMIFQEPMTALDPLYRVGYQITETLHAHERLSRKAAKSRAVELLTAVGIPDPAGRADAYPHQLSGGMRQRVMIAIAIGLGPALIIADEPTTALDVTIQAQILDLLRNLSEERGTAVLLITHDLGVVAETCQRVLTMYAGQLVETASVEEALLTPAHPYTSGLLGSVPTSNHRKQELPTIRGRIPQLGSMPAGCRFRPRCPHAEDRCREPQVLVPYGHGDRLVRCCRADELELAGALTKEAP